jgi:hypothetical protein
MPPIHDIHAAASLAGAGADFIQGLAPNPVTENIGRAANTVTGVTGPLTYMDHFSRSGESYQTGF